MTFTRNEKRILLILLQDHLNTVSELSMCVTIKGLTKATFRESGDTAVVSYLGTLEQIEAKLK